MSHPAPSRRATAVPRPDPQELLLAAIRSRDPLAGARLLEPWVHRRGIASLLAFRDTVVRVREGDAAADWLDQLIEGAAAPVPARPMTASEPAPAATTPAAAQEAAPAAAPAHSPAAAAAPVEPETTTPFSAAAVLDAALGEYLNRVESGATDPAPTAFTASPSSSLKAASPAVTAATAAVAAAAPPAPVSFSLAPPQESAATRPPLPGEIPAPVVVALTGEPSDEFAGEFAGEPAESEVPAAATTRWSSVLSRVREAVRDRLGEATAGFRSAAAAPQEGVVSDGSESSADLPTGLVQREESPAPLWLQPAISGTETTEAPRPSGWPHLFDFPRRATRPAPSPADLADLRAWLPGPSDDLPKAS